MSISYTLVLNSADRIDGSHHDPTFSIDWEAFLPPRINLFNVNFSFQTVGSYYKDSATNGHVYQSAYVLADFNCRNFSYDTKTSSQSKTLGLITRDPHNTNSIGISLGCNTDANPIRTMSRPTNTQVSFQIINQNDGELLVNTDSTAGQTEDMTPWTAIIEFMPLEIDVKTP